MPSVSEQAGQRWNGAFRGADVFAIGHAGIMFVDVLNHIKLGGYPLGFWFAQQGSIYIFIALIFYYAKKMNDLDRRFDVHED